MVELIQNKKGTRVQQKMKKILSEKQASFKTKYTTFHRLVSQFNTNFPQPTPIDCPSFEILRGLNVYDPFWDLGQLTHPGEPWAVDHNTQEGIQTYLAMTHARDELARLGREARQMIKWALDIDDKLSVLRTALAVEGELYHQLPVFLLCLM